MWRIKLFILDKLDDILEFSYRKIHAKYVNASWYYTRLRSEDRE